jgi:hypothetical protein
MRSFITVLFARYNKNDQVKEYENDRACSMNGREAKCIYDFCEKARMKKTNRKTYVY